MMMDISREKVNQISKSLLKAIVRDENVELFVEDNDIRLKIVDILNEEIMTDRKIEREVRKKLDAYSHRVIEGTNEWDILFAKHYAEENKRVRGITL